MRRISWRGEWGKRGVEGGEEGGEKDGEGEGLGEEEAEWHADAGCFDCNAELEANLHHIVVWQLDDIADQSCVDTAKYRANW